MENEWGEKEEVAEPAHSASCISEAFIASRKLYASRKQAQVHIQHVLYFSLKYEYLSSLQAFHFHLM